MKRKTISGSSLVMALVIVASGLLLSVLGQRQYIRATTDEVWVAAGNLNPGQIIGSNDLEKLRLRDDEVAGAVTNPRVMMGKRLEVNKEEGEAFYPGDFSKGGSKETMSMAVPEGRVIYTLVPDPSLLPYSGQLKKGDRFDILITQRGRVTPLAFDVILLGTLKNNQKSSEPQGRSAITALALPPGADKDSSAESNSLLVLAVHPNHVFPLASAHGSKAKISFVVHGQKELQKGERLSVLPNTRPVEIYSGLDKTRVKVRS